jgi:hypothetical protein
MTSQALCVFGRCRHSVNMRMQCCHTSKNEAYVYEHIIKTFWRSRHATVKRMAKTYISQVYPTQFDALCLSKMVAMRSVCATSHTCAQLSRKQGSLSDKTFTCTAFIESCTHLAPSALHVVVAPACGLGLPKRTWFTIPTVLSSLKNLLEHAK